LLKFTKRIRKSVLIVRWRGVHSAIPVFLTLTLLNNVKSINQYPFIVWYESYDTSNILTDSNAFGIINNQSINNQQSLMNWFNFVC